MERKIKGISIMIFGLFLCVAGVFLFLMSLRFIAVIFGAVIAAIMQLIGIYLVFTNKNNQTEKVMQDFISGKEE